MLIPIIHLIESILAPILNAIAVVIQWIFEIPVIGRGLNIFWNGIVTLANGIVGLFDTVAGIAGIRPEKHMYLVVINQRDENGELIATSSDIEAAIARTIQVYRDDANVRVLPFTQFDFTTPASEDQGASDDAYVVNCDPNSTAYTLDVDCGASDFIADLGHAGSLFQNMVTTNSFWTNWQRLLGYGPPVFVFSVRKFSGNNDGCSLGPLTDYVLVNFTGASPDTTGNQTVGKASILPHEIGHACNLWHVDPSNLMQPDDPRTTNLNWWQIALLRSSRHVTYFG